MSGMKKILLVMGISMMAALAGCAGKGDIAEEPVDAVVSEDEVESNISENEISASDVFGNEEDENENDLPEDETAENEAEDEKMIYYVIDDKVNEMPLFSAFINGEVTAYDNELQEEMHCVDYYDKYCYDKYYFDIYGLQITAEDLDGDGEEELMMIISTYPSQGDLYVFHEEDGRLYAWESIKNFIGERFNTFLLEDGTLESWGGYGRGRHFRHYNENGKLEMIMDDDYYSSLVNDEEEILYTYRLTIYEQGEAVRELGYSLLLPRYSSDFEEGELVAGTQEEYEEYERIYHEFLERLPDELREFTGIWYMDNVVEIPLSTIVVNPDMR